MPDPTILIRTPEGNYVDKNRQHFTGYVSDGADYVRLTLNRPGRSRRKIVQCNVTGNNWSYKRKLYLGSQKNGQNTVIAEALDSEGNVLASIDRIITCRKYLQKAPKD